ncbi:MFS transporter [Actinokineospora spheciospongiae]|uniref:MFS transporter n=1 Tax=Actinokineospora spheciospongiae TaxID=909613 RepID=UPI000D709B09|nr:MFS transporter [Actinokineospora spheciospongiae]PWW57015.1 putative MFS family arabinose efflux permease [Actinokineospora spheciospongiae]
MRRFPPAVRLLLVNQFGVNAGFYLLIPYLATYLTEDIGLTIATVGLVLGARNLSQQGLFLLGGTASDRLGARGVIIAGCGLRAVGFGLFAVGESLPVLLAAAVLSGLAGALFNPAVRAYISLEVGEGQRADAFALFNVFAQTGALVGPVLGAALLLVDFRVSAVVAAGIFAALTVAQALVLPARAVPPAPGTVWSDVRECLGNKRFVAFTLALSGMFALQNQLYLVLPVEARRLTGTPASVAALFIASTVVTLLAQVRITRALADRPRGWSIALGLVLMGLAFAAPALAYLWPSPGALWPGLAPVLVAAVLLAVGLAVAQPFVYELIPAFGAERVTGTYFGVFYLGSGAVAAVSTVVVGWAGEGSHGWAASVLCLLLGIGGAVGVLLLDRRGALAPQPERVA